MTEVGLRDKLGRSIKHGDIVLFLNESENTKSEYWYPVYQVVYEAPSFVLRYKGGGKPNDSMAFIFKNCSNRLLVLRDIEK